MYLTLFANPDKLAEGLHNLERNISTSTPGMDGDRMITHVKPYLAMDTPPHLLDEMHQYLLHFPKSSFRFINNMITLHPQHFQKARKYLKLYHRMKYIYLYYKPKPENQILDRVFNDGDSCDFRATIFGMCVPFVALYRHVLFWHNAKAALSISSAPSSFTTVVANECLNYLVDNGMIYTIEHSTLGTMVENFQMVRDQLTSDCVFNILEKQRLHSLNFFNIFIQRIFANNYTLDWRVHEELFFGDIRDTLSIVGVRNTKGVEYSNNDNEAITANNVAEFMDMFYDTDTTNPDHFVRALAHPNRHKFAQQIYKRYSGNPIFELESTHKVHAKWFFNATNSQMLQNQWRLLFRNLFDPSENHVDVNAGAVSTLFEEAIKGLPELCKGLLETNISPDQVLMRLMSGDSYKWKENALRSGFLKTRQQIMDFIDTNHGPTSVTRIFANLMSLANFVPYSGGTEILIRFWSRILFPNLKIRTIEIGLPSYFPTEHHKNIVDKQLKALKDQIINIQNYEVFVVIFHFESPIAAKDFHYTSMICTNKQQLYCEGSYAKTTLASKKSQTVAACDPVMSSKFKFHQPVAALKNVFPSIQCLVYDTHCKGIQVDEHCAIGEKETPYFSTILPLFIILSQLNKNDPAKFDLYSATLPRVDFVPISFSVLYTMYLSLLAHPEKLEDALASLHAFPQYIRTPQMEKFCKPSLVAGTPQALIGDVQELTEKTERNAYMFINNLLRLYPHDFTRFKRELKTIYQHLEMSYYKTKGGGGEEEIVDRVFCNRDSYNPTWATSSVSVYVPFVALYRHLLFWKNRR